MKTTLLPPMTSTFANFGSISARWADVLRVQREAAAKLTEMLSMMQRQERKGGNPFLVRQA